MGKTVHGAGTDRDRVWGKQYTGWGQTETAYGENSTWGRDRVWENSTWGGDTQSMGKTVQGVGTDRNRVWGKQYMGQGQSMGKTVHGVGTDRVWGKQCMGRGQTETYFLENNQSMAQRFNPFGAEEMEICIPLPGNLKLLSGSCLFFKF